MARFGTTLSALALVLTAPAIVHAQQEQSQQQAGQEQLAQQDQTFAESAAMINMAEIQEGELAVEKAQMGAVKDYGQQMIDDHTMAGEKLNQIALELGVDLPQQLDSEHQQKIDQLSSVPEGQFDRQYVQAQVEGHQKAIELFQQQTEQGENQQLVGFAEETLPTLEEHLRMAEDLEQQVSSGQMAQGGTAGGTEDAAEQVQASGTISLDQFMGKTVIGSDGKELGEVSDIIVDPESGEAQQLVIDSGGFLGIGEKEIAIDFAEAELAAEQDAVQVSSMTQADVEGAEEFQRTEDMQFYGGATSTDVPARSSPQ